MYKNKSEHGLNNICGQKIRKLRLEMKNVSQRKLADMLPVSYTHLTLPTTDQV